MFSHITGQNVPQHSAYFVLNRKPSQFSDQEKEHMHEQAKQQGGETTDVGDGSCTHLVVEENTVSSLPFEPTGKLYILVQEVIWCRS